MHWFTVSSYFKRSIRLLAGQRGSETAIDLGSLRVVFEILKTDKRSNNTAVIRVYNLSDKTKSLLDKKNTVVTLSAGYEQGLGTGVIFSGDISDIQSERNGADIITVLELSDGTTVIKDKTVSIAMAGTVSPKDALKKIADSIGLPINISGTISAKSYQSGFASYGAPMEAINKICRKIGFSYSVENGVLNLWKNTDGKKEQVLYLTPSTGLIGKPEKIQIDKQNGWSVKALLSPLITPAGRVKVKSDAVSGLIRVKSVKHSGDTHGGDWTSTAEAVIVS